MPMPLTDPSRLRQIFEIDPSDKSQDAILALYASEASAAIYSWTQIKDFGLILRQELPRSYELNAITTDQVPIIGTTLSAATVSGSPIVTVPSTVGLFINQCCAANCPNFPAGQTTSQSSPPTPNQLYIVSIGSGAVTMSQNANVTGACTMNLGVALWQDQNAYGGSTPNSFQTPNTLLQEGSDYYIDWDSGPGGVCTSGIINSMNSIFFAPQVFFGSYITPLQGRSQSSVKLQYYSGGIGPNGIPGTVPWAVSAACEMLVAIMRRTGPFGKETTSLSDGQLSATLGAAAKLGVMDPSVTTLLAPYKTVRVGA